MNILVIVEIGIAIHLLNAFTKFTTLATRTKFFEFLKQTIYFESLITDNDLSSIFYYWMYILSFSLIACSAILICSVVRLFKTKKYVLKQQEENQKKVQLNQHLGFDYENSDFYQQVKIPYSSLQQTDGTRGEFEVYHMLRKCGLTNSTYVFNREIPKSDGLTTELDLILLHNKGIFVIENKHYTTRIFGNASDHDLTIIDYKGKKKSVYNPIRQNEKHVIALQEFLQSKNLYINDKETPIYSIVVFTAEWEDKTDDIISGITTLDTKTKVCTSQNVFHVINQLILSSDSTVNINVVDIANLLSNLPLRKKYS